MHGHGEKPFLCKFEGCERGFSGNGFPRHWNLCDHMKRVHNRSPSPSPGSSFNARASGRKKRSQNTPSLDSHRRERALGLNEERDSRRAAYDFSSEYSPKLSSAQIQFRDKTEELIAAVRKVRSVDDKDALRNLRAAEDCLKFLTSEVMKTKVGSEGLTSKGDVELPD